MLRFIPPYPVVSPVYKRTMAGCLAQCARHYGFLRKCAVIAMVVQAVLPARTMAQQRSLHHGLFAGYGIASHYLLSHKEQPVAGLLRHTDIRLVAPRSSGCWLGGYRYISRRGFLAGVSFTYETVSGDTRSSTSAGTWQRSAMTLLPSFGFRYYQRPFLDFYTQVAAGLLAETETTHMDRSNSILINTRAANAGFAWQVTLLGVEVSKSHIGAFVEAGYGFRGIASAGVVLKF